MSTLNGEPNTSDKTSEHGSSKMEPTPDLSHLTRRDYDRVYEPAGMDALIFPLVVLDSSISEDTFLLLDALELDANALRAAKPQICLEIG